MASGDRNSGGASQDPSRGSGRVSGRESVSDRAGSGGYGASSGFAEESHSGSDSMRRASSSSDLPGNGPTIGDEAAPSSDDRDSGGTR